MSVLLLFRWFLLMAGCARRWLLWVQGCVAQLVSRTACPPFAVGRDRSCCGTVGTSAPVHDLGFVDLVAQVVGRRQAGGRADGAVDVDHPVAGSADEMVVIVANPVLVAGRRPGGLDPPEEPLV